ncbi:hypothetical protein [Aquipseudomonas ullengensis]|uniref:Uncharacterized protein n=1 Tax=Aquipseudomonas ullengensis TaxID=2759166 RepID=A0A7W4LKJ6_9GAMM|nr:hypothetical protein [Pseudomonas ullengensis]MBB2494831.1 hypothetical protein [Pseudomonas ullengensis]
MSAIRLLIGLAAITALPVMAGEVVRRPLQAVPIEYVSPGASGSVSSSSRSQIQNLYGGQALPEGYGRQSQSSGSSSVQQSGGIRQSTEYPGGYEVQRYPGQNSYEVQRSR